MRLRVLLPWIAVVGIGACSGPTQLPRSVAITDGAFRSEISPPTRRRLRLEDYYRIEAVGSPRISPDGTWVTYTVSTPIEEDNGSANETWAVRTDGAARPRHLQHDGREISVTRWSGSSRLRYTVRAAEGSDEEQAPGVGSQAEETGTDTWEIDLDSPASRPTRVIERDGIASPDRRWIATLREIPVPEETTEYATDFLRRHAERFEGVSFDWMNFQRDGAPFPVPDPRRSPAQEIVLQPLEAPVADVGGLNGDGPGSADDSERQITDLGLRPRDLAWHPDGKMLAFLADEQFRDEATYGRPDLYTVTVDGDVERLTDDGYTYSSLGFSPGGEFLSYIRGYGTDMVIAEKLDHGGPRDLFLRPMEGEGQPVNLTADWDLEPSGPRWTPDGEYLYFTAGIGGARHLFRVSPYEGGVEQVTTGERRLGGISIDDDFTRIAYTVGRFEAPSEVYAASIDGGNERRLTSIHDQILDEIGFSEAERFVFPSYDGTPIEGWLLYPYGYDREAGPYPLIVHSHGGPHSASGYGFSFKHQYFAANGYFVLQTNFRSSTGYGERFKWATWGAWGDLDGQDVMAGVDFVLERLPIDPQRVGTTGHSYGGFMSNWLIVQYPERFAAAVVGAGISNWISDYGTADIARTKETEFFGPPWQEHARRRLLRQSPLIYADNARTPTLFIHGEVDQRVPYEEAEQMYFALKKNGVPAKMIVYAGQSHGIRGHWNNVHRMMSELAWWERWLER